MCGCFQEVVRWHPLIKHRKAGFGNWGDIFYVATDSGIIKKRTDDGTLRFKFVRFVLRESEHAFGIVAGGVKCGKFLHDSGTVGCVCHAKPFGVGVEDLDGSFSGIDQRVHCQRNEEFAFGSVDVLVEEFLEFALGIFEIVGSEAPQVHGHRCGRVKGLFLAVFIGEHDVVVLVVGNGGAFHH